MDIMPAFEAVVPGSNPGGCTHNKKLLSKEFFVMCAPEKASGKLSPRIRTAQRDPSKLAWERAGAQTKIFDGKFLVEGETPGNLDSSDRILVST